MTSTHRYVLHAALAAAAILGSLAAASAQDGSTTIDADDPRIHYIGRFDFADSKRPACDWPGCYIEAAFQGTSVAIRLASPASPGTNYFAVYVDNAFVKRVDLPARGDQQFPIKSGMADTTHTIRIVRRTEPACGRNSFTGFALDKGKTLVPSPSRTRRIEFIGDSFTCGGGNEATATTTAPYDFIWGNADQGFAPMVARHFNADYHMVACSGGGMANNPVPAMYLRTIGAEPNDNYTFAWKPDAVIILLGINDGYPPAQAPYEDKYRQFIKVVRSKYPNALICCGYLSNMHPATKAFLKNVVAQANDNRVVYMDFEYTLNNPADMGYCGHPNIAGDAKIANSMIPVIEKAMGWQDAGTVGKADPINSELIRYMSTLEIVDAHEHFPDEEQHLKTPYNFYWWLVPYVQYDLVSAGMKAENLWRMPDSDPMTKAYWEEIGPLWGYVKHGSYAEPVRMALKEFYGIDDITDANYLQLGEKMRATRYPGRYKEILRDRCHIKHMLNQAGRYGYDKDSFMKGSITVFNVVNTAGLQAFKKATPRGTLDDYLNSVRDELHKAREAGAVLAKFDANCFVSTPDRAKAEAAFRDFDATSVFINHGDLGGYLYDRCIDLATNEGLVISVHTGVWANITWENPELLFPVVMRHPKSTFDVYHMGMPYVRECGFLGKNYPNVYLNLAWSHIVSPRMAVDALDEWLDYVPTNKIFAFGGDCTAMPELVWAHLEIAKRNLAEVFARRIMRGQLTMEESRKILKLWFYDNPVRVYGLK